MTNKKKILFSVVFALIIFCIQDLLVFQFTNYEGIKELFLWIFKIVLFIIYFEFVRMIFEILFDFLECVERINNYYLIFYISSLSFVFSLSSFIINSYSLIFDAILGSISVLSIASAIHFLNKINNEEKNK